MKIQELSGKTGLSVHAIRFYEKEGLLDSRHVQREGNNYRHYSGEAIGRIKLIKKFQSIDCSIAELKGILQDYDANIQSNEQIMEWMRGKKQEIERKKAEYDHMIEILDWMLEYRRLLAVDPDQARDMLASWQTNSLS